MINTTEALIEDLNRERDALLELLATVDAGSWTTPGLIGEWSARDVLAHLGYWAGHAAEIIHAAEEGRIDQAGVGEPPVDEVNATVARIAHDTPLTTVKKREAASVEALVERLRALDPSLLLELLPDGATLEDGIREDGPVHYRGHALDLRRVLEAPARG